MYYFITLFDPTYLMVAIPALLLAFFANLMVKHTFRKYNRRAVSSGLTGGQAARLILDRYGLKDIEVECISGELTDHYDPRDKVLRLSYDVCNTPSIAAVGVAAHEAGHAIQHARHYVPVYVRTAIVPITNLGSTLAFPTVMLGVLLSQTHLVSAGIILFGLMTVFQLITLPVELNASHRAVVVLKECSYIQTRKEMRGVKKMLRAAALTYVAALLASVASLIRFITWARLFSRR